MTNDEFVSRALKYFGEFSEMCQIVLAGGAPRDLILGKEIKDLDFIIAIGGKSIDWVTDLSKKLYKLNFRLISDKKKNSKYEKAFAVYENKEDEVQVIFTEHKDVSYFISDTFDIGLCMVAIGPKGNFHVWDAFMKDARNKTLTLYARPSLTGAQLKKCVNDHFPRLLKKFPDFEPRIEISAGATALTHNFTTHDDVVEI